MNRTECLPAHIDLLKEPDLIFIYLLFLCNQNNIQES